MAGGIAFVKGHGTQNDFVLVPDAAGTLELDAALVRAICDRRAGLGSDGVIRVAPGDGGWFMDYRNADGSVAEMCGNGARVFARFLVDSGWAEPGLLEFGTRGGVRTAELGRSGDVRIGMGPVRLGGPATAVLAGTALPGRQVSVGNPHLVCVLDGPDAPARLAGLDLTAAPGVDAQQYPDGANVEFVVPSVTVGSASAALTMRVHERGVGETRSCGTGTVAAAAALLDGADGTVVVTVPGGRVTVDLSAGQAWLTGPAVLVASGVLDDRFVAER